MDTVALLTYAQTCYISNNLPTLLSTTTLGSTTASVTYNVTSLYNSMMVRWSASSTAAVTSTTLIVTCNGDTGSHYLSAILENSSGSVSGSFGSGITTGMQAATMAGASDTANYWSSGVFFLDGTNQTGHAPTLVGTATQFTSTAPLGHMGMYSGQWLSVAGVSSVTLAPGSGGGSFAAGSVFSFYGLS